MSARSEMHTQDLNTSTTFLFVVAALTVDFHAGSGIVVVSGSGGVVPLWMKMCLRTILLSLMFALPLAAGESVTPCER